MRKYRNIFLKSHPKATLEIDIFAFNSNSTKKNHLNKTIKLPK